jgi:hypothetical protein
MKKKFLKSAIFATLLAACAESPTSPNYDEPSSPSQNRPSSSSLWTELSSSSEKPLPLSSSFAQILPSSSSQKSSSSVTQSGGKPAGIPDDYKKIDDGFLYLQNGGCDTNKQREQDSDNCVLVSDVGIYVQNGDWPYKGEDFYIAATNGKISRETISTSNKRLTADGQYVPCYSKPATNPNNATQSVNLLPSKEACEKFKSDHPELDIR